MLSAMEILATAGTTARPYDPQEDCNEYNALPGRKRGPNCEICKNKGAVAYVDNGFMAHRKCSCHSLRVASTNLESSGLKNLIDKFSLEDYIATEDWQKSILSDAKRFIADCKGKSFFIGGAVGAGKTHICTGICKELLKTKAVHYMLWREDATLLKGMVNEPEYPEAVGKLKKIEVLYIDDFFKTKQGDNPTGGDVNLAFEILDYRCNNQLTTIISSERQIKDLLNVDDAVGSRIYLMAKDYSINISAGRDKNYRLKVGV
jgi:DNA replication protein DnaC